MNGSRPFPLFPNCNVSVEAGLLIFTRCLPVPATATDHVTVLHQLLLYVDCPLTIIVNYNVLRRTAATHENTMTEGQHMKTYIKAANQQILTCSC